MKILDKFQFQIKNTTANGTGATANIAIFHGTIDVEGLTAGNSSGSYLPTRHHHDVTNLVSAGYNVNAVLDDATVTIGDSTNNSTVVMATTNPSLSINHTMNSIKLNPRWVRSITINANNSSIFESATLGLCSMSPYHQEAAHEIDLSQYFDRYQQQSTKIEINYTKGELQLNDSLFMALNGMPTGSSSAPTVVKFIIELYDED